MKKRKEVRYYGWIIEGRTEKRDEAYSCRNHIAKTRFDSEVEVTYSQSERKYIIRSRTAGPVKPPRTKPLLSPEDQKMIPKRRRATHGWGKKSATEREAELAGKAS